MLQLQSGLWPKLASRDVLGFSNESLGFALHNLTFGSIEVDFSTIHNGGWRLFQRERDYSSRRPEMPCLWVIKKCVNIETTVSSNYIKLRKMG